MYKFEPILKTLIWGSESWQLSGVPGSLSVVFEGPEKGKTVADLLCEQHEQLVGRRSYERYGNVFPLLIKFIEANQPLSVQVHPNDELARKRHNSFGKTEMWYVLHAKKDAYLYAGFNRLLDPESYCRMVEDGSITQALAKHTLQEGDVFFLPAGRVHSIGGGTTIAEIQQTSDITYRIYDYKRKDKDGNYRVLHTKEAAESIDYTIHDDYRTDYRLPKNESVQLIQCPYFTTAIYDLTEPMTLDYSELDSFVILIAVKGEGTLTADGEETTFRMGDTILLPATTQEVKVEGEVKFLETYV